LGLLAPHAAAQDSTAVDVTAAAGKGITFSAGRPFAATLRTLFQPQLRVAAPDDDNPATAGGAEDVASFRLRRVETSLYGHVVDEDLQWKVLFDPTLSPALKDAWAQWWFLHTSADSLGVRFGQQKTLYGRESTASSGALDFVDRALPTRLLADVRAQGLALRGAHLGSKLHWNAGLFNTDAAAASLLAKQGGSNPDDELDAVLTARLDPAGDLGEESYAEGDLEHSAVALWSLGGGLQLGRHHGTLPGTLPDVDTTALNVNGAFKHHGWHVLGEAFLRRDAEGAEASAATAYQLGGSYVFGTADAQHAPWGLGLRYASLRLTQHSPVLLTGTPLGTALGDTSEITLAVSKYHHGHALKTQAAWTLQRVAPDGSPAALNNVFELQVTILF